MNSLSRPLQWLVWGILIAVIAGISIAFILSERHRQPPLPVYGQIPDFTLTNQFGQPVRLADLKGSVWVADIIFTACAGPCPRMTQFMSQLQEALPEGPVKLVTLTTDPDNDSTAVLKRYGDRYGARPERWQFLTGAKSEIRRLAADGLKLAAVEKKPEERENESDLFIHSTIFVVVDQQGRLRGSFETVGENVDPKKARQDILDAVNRLIRNRGR
jgi:cytochrome oxidase Cu insertion factor (SCO1/SenC/PrrC family)